MTTVPVPNENDREAFRRQYPGRPGEMQLDTQRFLMGLDMLPLFRRLGGLKPTEDVLDVGCGAGRMAYALSMYLNGGSYEGFDTIEGLIRWAQNSITPSAPAFRFRHVPIYNSVYCPDGTIRADDFIFPYPSGSFDFAILTSVFTHIRGVTVRHYLGELARVLRPGGRVFGTWYLLNQETDSAMRSGRTDYALVHPVEDGFTHEPANPELAIGYRQDEVVRWVEHAGLVVEGIHAGKWAGRTEWASGQDVLVARKPSAAA